jgi:hypothetical protein
LNYKSLTTDAKPDGKGRLTALKLIKEYEKHICCKKVTFVSMYCLSMLPTERGVKETFACGPFSGFGSIPPPHQKALSTCFTGR